MNNSIPSIALGPDQMLPAVGFGTYLIDNDEVGVLVEEAISAGYRHIDTAEIYANEVGVGQGMARGIKATGLSRDDVFVTTKLWPGHSEWGQPIKNYEMTLSTLNLSLENLQLDFVDLYLIHAPVAQAMRLEQWRALVDLRQQGKVKAIGVSNYGQHHIQEIETAGMPLPSVNQIELHPWSQKPELVAALRSRNIAITAYSSLVPLSNWRESAGDTGARVEQRKAKADPASSPFPQLAEKYAVSEAQLLLRWGLQKGYVVLPKSVHPERIKQNFQLFHFQIDPSDMALMDGLNRGAGLAWGLNDPTLVD